jgi:hypothetical protein
VLQSVTRGGCTGALVAVVGVFNIFCTSHAALRVQVGTEYYTRWLHRGVSCCSWCLQHLLHMTCSARYLQTANKMSAGCVCADRPAALLVHMCSCLRCCSSSPLADVRVAEAMLLESSLIPFVGICGVECSELYSLLLHRLIIVCRCRQAVCLQAWHDRLQECSCSSPYMHMHNLACRGRETLLACFAC